MDDAQLAIVTTLVVVLIAFGGVFIVSILDN